MKERRPLNALFVALNTQLNKIWISSIKLSDIIVLNFLSFIERQVKEQVKNLECWTLGCKQESSCNFSTHMGQR